MHDVICILKFLEGERYIWLRELSTSPTPRSCVRVLAMVCTDSGLFIHFSRPVVFSVKEVRVFNSSNGALFFNPSKSCTK